MPLAVLVIALTAAAPARVTQILTFGFVGQITEFAHNDGLGLFGLPGTVEWAIDLAGR